MVVGKLMRLVAMGAQGSEDVFVEVEREGKYRIMLACTEVVCEDGFIVLRGVATREEV